MNNEQYLKQIINDILFVTISLKIWSKRKKCKDAQGGLHSSFLRLAGVSVALAEGVEPTLLGQALQLRLEGWWRNHLVGGELDLLWRVVLLRVGVQQLVARSRVVQPAVVRGFYSALCKTSRDVWVLRGCSSVALTYRANRGAHLAGGRVVVHRRVPHHAGQARGTDAHHSLGNRFLAATGPRRGRISPVKVALRDKDVYWWKNTLQILCLLNDFFMVHFLRYFFNGAILWQLIFVRLFSHQRVIGFLHQASKILGKWKF